MTNMKYKIELPKTAYDVPLYRYQNFLLIDEPTPDDVLSTLAGISASVIRKLPASSVYDITNHCNAFLEPPKLIREFKLDGEHFGFIPALDEITWGENRDITEYLPTPENKGKNLHRAMAVLYRPIVAKKNGKYQIEEYEGTHARAEQMKRMPMNVALSALDFFFHLSNELLKLIPNYIQQAIQTDPTFSLKNGHHITSSLHCVMTTLRDLNKLQKNDYTNAYCTSPIESTKTNTTNENSKKKNLKV